MNVEQLKLEQQLWNIANTLRGKMELRVFFNLTYEFREQNEER
ncbi:MAG: hypothetical protein U9N77_04720 [Thermodesulfobacteriota bacterium]|nr:hypothetical protein [Thermodesulfobacteriota bacterium]